jgi:mRNA-degrading endonuclease RelE of RelBE toxin-antitoxin system
MVAMAKSRALEVDRRVGIALSVLPPSQRSAVERVVRSPQTFTRVASIPGRVRQLRTSGQPLYMMRVSPKLRLIYTTVGETVYVVDVVEHATLNHFAAPKAAKP